MSLTYFRFDPSPCNFPHPRIPVLPQPNIHHLVWRTNRTRREVRHYTSGRYALGAAYALSGVGTSGALLAPAYHCRTMLDPAIQLNADIALYPLTPNLEPDLDLLMATASNCRTPPRALLLTHYFGVPCKQLNAVANWCKQQNITLIEDCSHLLVPVNDSQTTIRAGYAGQYVVSSPYKFFPCPDGGILWANHGAPLPFQRTAPPGLVAEIRGFYRVISKLLSNQSNTSFFAGITVEETEPLPPSECEWIEETSCWSEEYRPEDRERSSLFVSRWIQRHTDKKWLMTRRRENYLQWVEAVHGLPNCHALFPQLDAEVTPYMFPLFINDSAKYFFLMKNAGLPIWRWDSMAVSECNVARQYRQCLLHLPCHQELTREEILWMVSVLKQVLCHIKKK